MLRFGAVCLALLGANALETGTTQLGLPGQVELRQRLQELSPQDQQDLALVVPDLQRGDKVAFKQKLSVMVQNGGNDRIRRCLQGLTEVGFDALEIQRWLQQDAPLPRSRRTSPLGVNAIGAPQSAVLPKEASTNLAAEEQLRGQAKKAEAKSALRKELARRLSKGMQAFQKVMALEQDEAGLKQQLWAEHQRVDRLEEALQREEKQRDEVMKENLELKKEMQHEAQVNDQTAQRLDALEKGHSAGAETRVQALEEENVKFRAALAGAARRLINLEADVTSQRQVAHGVNIQHHPAAYHELIRREAAGLGCSSWAPVTLVDGSGAGYAVAGEAELRFLMDVAGAGVILDHTYAGKALYHFCDYAKVHPERFRDSHILFWHTGGLFGLYTQAERLQKMLPAEQLQVYNS